MTSEESIVHSKYSVFGSLTASSGEYAEENPFRFSSEYSDMETGLVYYNYRYYSPELGRWLSRDPIEEQGGYNLYGMVGNGIVNSWDYLGLLAWSVPIVKGATDLAMSVCVLCMVAHAKRMADKRINDWLKEKEEERKRTDRNNSSNSEENDSDLGNNNSQNEPPKGPTPKPPLDGRPQHGDARHNQKMREEALRQQEAGNTDIRTNQQLTDPKGNPVSKVRPDVQSTRPDGKRNVTEIQSPSQSKNFMNNKIDKIRHDLGSNAGDVKWIPY